MSVHKLRAKVLLFFDICKFLSFFPCVSRKFVDKRKENCLPEWIWDKAQVSKEYRKWAYKGFARDKNRSIGRFFCFFLHISKKSSTFAAGNKNKQILLIKIKRMKKILVAVMAVCTMVLGFTSCEKTADVNVYPIAGKTYQATDEDGYSRVTFKKNFGAVMEVKTTMQESYSDLYVWEMATKADQEGKRDLYIKFANGAMNKITGEDLSGKTAFQGYYNGVNCYLYPMWPAEMPEAVLEYKPLLQ